MDYRIKEIIRVMKLLKDECNRIPEPKLQKEALNKGLRISKDVCRQQEFVYATPLMKNLLVCMGDVKQTQNPDGEWVTEKLRTGAPSKAVDWLNEVVNAVLVKYNGPKVERYDHTLPVFDPQHYNTDCWLGWKPTVWDIAPGQAEQRRETFVEYSKRKTNLSYDQMIKLLQSDRELQKAVLVELECWPEVRAAGDIESINDPFMSKGTGVSYPYFANDKTLVPGSGQTYGELTVEIVRKAYREHGVRGLLQVIYDYNMYTAYARNQRGKGRALIAQSRLTNLGINVVNGPEMEALKDVPFLGCAFQPIDAIKETLIKLGEFAEANGYWVANKDFTSWDKTVGEGWLILGNAVRYMKANGETARRIIAARCACNCISKLVDGPNGKVHPIFGRMMSGYIDTTLGNTSINRIQARACVMKQDRQYSERITYPSHFGDLLAVGDDLCLIMKPDTDKGFVEASAKYGFEAHADQKDAFGAMFIQYRVIRKDGKYVMGYNWPRVLRSGMSKENQKSLGPAGWTISFWQQCEKLIEMPEYLRIVVSIFAALDKERLMLDRPIDEIKAMIKREDEAAKEKLKGNQKNKFLTTAERITTNPQLKHTLTGDDFNYDHLADVQKKLRDAYDPEFLPSLGFKNPDLSQVK